MLKIRLALSHSATENANKHPLELSFRLRVSLLILLESFCFRCGGAASSQNIDHHVRCSHEEVFTVREH